MTIITPLSMFSTVFFSDYRINIFNFELGKRFVNWLNASDDIFMPEKLYSGEPSVCGNNIKICRGTKINNNRGCFVKFISGACVGYSVASDSLGVSTSRIIPLLVLWEITRTGIFKYLSTAILNFSVRGSTTLDITVLSIFFQDPQLQLCSLRKFRIHPLFYFYQKTNSGINKNFIVKHPTVIFVLPISAASSIICL